MFDHVTIRVPDLEEARAFYGLALGQLGFGEPATDGHFFDYHRAFVLDTDGNNVEAV